VHQRPRPRQYLAAGVDAEPPVGGASPLLEAMGARFGWISGVDTQAVTSSERASGSQAAGEAEEPKSTGGQAARLANGGDPDDDLQQGAVRGDLTKVKRALEKRASVAATNVRGVTPLMLASSSGGKEALEVLKLLLENEADLEVADNNGWGKTQVVRHILAERAKPDPQTTDHRTTLMLAVMEGKLDLVKELIQLKQVRAQVSEKDALSVSAVHCAAKEGTADILKLLFESNARANVVDIEGRTPLMWACQHGKLDAAKALVKAGGDIFMRDKTERTPLWHACMNSSESVAIWLLKKWADPGMQDVLGDSPMSLANELGLSKFKRATEMVDVKENEET